MLKNSFVMAVGLGVAGCTALPGAPVEDGKNRVVDIVNTGEAPLAFYAVNAARFGVFRARIAEREVAPAYYTTVNFADGSGACFYNFHAELASGEKAEATRLDVCNEVVWVVTPEMLQ